MPWKVPQATQIVMVPEEQLLARQEAIRAAREATSYKPTLLFREKANVMSVLTPVALEEAKTFTKGFGWAPERGVLYPARKTRVFAGPEGGSLIRTQVSRNFFRIKVAGTIEEFERFALDFEIETEEVPEIFVPFVDTTHLDYRAQGDAIFDCGRLDIYKDLLASQFPLGIREKLLLL